MTNEELATAVQNGNNELMSQLWEQCRGFICQQATKWAAAWKNRSDIDKDDFTQAGYIAMCKAVRYWREDRGAFLTILGYYLKTEFSEVAGCRTETKLNEPLNKAVSLDAPISGDPDKEITMGETVAADDTGIEDAEEAVFQDQLSKTVNEAVCKLPERQRIAIEGHYLKGQPHKDIAREIGCSRSYVAELIKVGFNALRSGSSGPTLCELMYFNRDLYHGTGYAAWKNTGSSVQERHIIRNDEIVRKHRYSNARVDKINYCIYELGMDRGQAERLFPA